MGMVLIVGDNVGCCFQVQVDGQIKKSAQKHPESLKI